MNSNLQNSDAYTIENTNLNDLPVVFQMFEDAIAWQKINNHIAWNGYDKEALSEEIKQQRQLKMVCKNTIMAVFSICYNDPVIWRHMDNNNAIYLHRIVVNQTIKGQRLFEKILLWAKENAASRNLSFIRMDTWGNNNAIIDYYKRYGFRLVEYYTTPDTAELSEPYRNLHLALLESSI